MENLLFYGIIGIIGLSLACKILIWIWEHIIEPIHLSVWASKVDKDNRLYRLEQFRNRPLSSFSPYSVRDVISQGALKLFAREYPEEVIHKDGKLCLKKGAERSEQLERERKQQEKIRKQEKTTDKSKCSNCGAPLMGDDCPYCGANYTKPSTAIKFSDDLIEDMLIKEALMDKALED